MLDSIRSYLTEHWIALNVNAFLYGVSAFFVVGTIVAIVAIARLIWDEHQRRS